MQHRFGVCGSALKWLADFLKDRTQIVLVSSSESATLALKFGVLQNSVNGSNRFFEFTEDITCHLVKHDLAHHLNSQTIHRVCCIAYLPTFHRQCRISVTASPTSVVGVRPSAYSWRETTASVWLRLQSQENATGQWCHAGRSQCHQISWRCSPNWRTRPRYSNNRSLLFSSTSAALGSSTTWSWRRHPASRCSRLLASWLMQCRARWSTGHYTRTVSASSPWCRSTGEQATSTMPRYVGIPGAPLAADC